MDPKYLIPLLLIFIVCSCETINIKHYTEQKRLPDEEPLIVIVKPEGIKRNFRKPFVNSNFLRFYTEDILHAEKQIQIAKAKISNNKNTYHFEHILLKIEEVAREVGSNYVVVEKLVQYHKPFTNKIKAYYYLANTEEVRKHEIAFKWSKNRIIQETDFAFNGLQIPDTVSSFQHSARLSFSGDLRPTMEFVNEFIRKQDSCGKCNALTLKQENVKFDLIELYQRKQVKYTIETFKTNPQIILESNNLFHPYILSLEQKFTEIQNIQDIKKLKILENNINAEIEELNHYKDKTIIDILKYVGTVQRR